MNKQNMFQESRGVLRRRKCRTLGEMSEREKGFLAETKVSELSLSVKNRRKPEDQPRWEHLLHSFL